MIHFDNLSMRYPGSETDALDRIDLELAEGDFCFLTGPSGAGKSTFLRLLFVAERATSGALKIRGRDLATLKSGEVPYMRRNIGVVFQDFKLLPERTVVENVAIALEIQGTPRFEITERVHKVLEQVGLAKKAHKLAAQLSGGEQQRVAIARALVADPSILLCDEPTGNLDPERSKDIMDLLVGAHKRGATVIIATHDPALLRRYPARLVRLEAGKLVDTKLPTDAQELRDTVFDTHRSTP